MAIIPYLDVEKKLESGHAFIINTTLAECLKKKKILITYKKVRIYTIYQKLLR